MTTWDEPWRKQAMAAILEGFCPEGHGPLELDAHYIRQRASDISYVALMPQREEDS